MQPMEDTTVPESPPLDDFEIKLREAEEFNRRMKEQEEQEQREQWLYAHAGAMSMIHNNQVHQQSDLSDWYNMEDTPAVQTKHAGIRDSFIDTAYRVVGT